MVCHVSQPDHLGQNTDVLFCYQHVPGFHLTLRHQIEGLKGDVRKSCVYMKSRRTFGFLGTFCFLLLLKFFLVVFSIEFMMRKQTNGR